MELTLTMIVYFAGTIYLANLEERNNEKRKNEVAPQDMSGRLRFLLYLGIGLAFYLGLNMLLLSLGGEQLSDGGDAILKVEPSLAILTFLITSALSLWLLFVVRSTATRQVIKDRLGHPNGYDNQSIVHTTAIVMTVLLLIGWVVTAMLVEGSPEPAVWEIAFQLVIEVFFALLGVGWTLRRTWANVLHRLGLRLPTQDDVVHGLLTGVVLVVLMFFYSYLGSILGLLPEESEDIYLPFATVLGAFFLSASAAVGEELVFRGALQPIFGLLLTSLAFTLLHITTIAPFGLGYIFIVAYALGRLREQQSTTAAIFGHFIYNFIQLLLLTAAVSTGAV